MYFDLNAMLSQLWMNLTLLKNSFFIYQKSFDRPVFSLSCVVPSFEDESRVCISHYNRGWINLLILYFCNLLFFYSLTTSAVQLNLVALTEKVIFHSLVTIKGPYNEQLVSIHPLSYLLRGVETSKVRDERYSLVSFQVKTKQSNDRDWRWTIFVTREMLNYSYVSF